MKDFGRFLGAAVLASMALACAAEPNVPKIAPEPLPRAGALLPSRYPQKEVLPPVELPRDPVQRMTFEQALQKTLEGLRDFRDEQETENWQELAAVWSKGFTLGKEFEAANERIGALLKFFRTSRNPFISEAYKAVADYQVLVGVVEGDFLFNDGNRNYGMMLADNVIYVSSWAILSGEESDSRLAVINVADLLYTLRSLANNPGMDEEVRAGASSAASLEAMLREMGMTGDSRIDGVGRRTIEGLLGPYLACGRANNECFRGAVGDPSVPLPQGPETVLPPDSRRL